MQSVICFVVVMAIETAFAMICTDLGFSSALGLMLTVTLQAEVQLVQGQQTRSK